MAKQHTGWADRHRPKTLKAMALKPELRKRFAWYLAGESLPHSLILWGPPGVGKTTIATILADTLYANDGWPRVRRVKATETGTVDAIRTNVIDSMRAMPGPRVLIFEEASALSRDAQVALRVPMDEYADHCRVIFIMNDPPSKFDGAIISRCQVIEMRAPPVEECVRVLGNVLREEGISMAPAAMEKLVSEHYKWDFRKLLDAAEYAIATSRGAIRRSR